jgi:hypothetical protein
LRASKRKVGAVLIIAVSGSVRQFTDQIAIRLERKIIAEKIARGLEIRSVCSRSCLANGKNKIGIMW